MKKLQCLIGEAETDHCDNNILVYAMLWEYGILQIQIKKVDGAWKCPDCGR